jgi:hypothetical protein
VAAEEPGDEEEQGSKRKRRGLSPQARAQLLVLVFKVVDAGLRLVDTVGHRLGWW